MKKQLGIIGLGKMGGNLALQLVEKGWQVVGYNRSRKKTENLGQKGVIPAYSIEEFVSKLELPRVVWIMVPAGDSVDQTISSLTQNLEQGDIIIDAGNSFYKNSIKRGKKLREQGLKFVDVGVSGGPHGARHGACMMIGGLHEDFSYLETLFKDLTVEGGYAHFKGTGAGHFVKMVHNGIEYGMMQAIAEGFTVMKSSDFALNLTEVARVYNHESVITSKLIGWMHSAYKQWGEDLDSISGKVSQSGEGEWTVKAADELGVPVDIIKRSLKFRQDSQENPSYIGKVVSALRGQFGGHPVLITETSEVEERSGKTSEVKRS